MDLSILIVSYRTCSLTRACLASVGEHPASGEVEVVVVDNASGDGSAEMIRSEFPEVQLVESEHNLGFARAVNLAAERSVGRFLLLLNPDTVVHEGSIDALVRYAESHPEGGLYGGRTLTPDGAVDPSSCWGRPTPWSLLCFGLGLSTLFRRSRLFDPESLGGWQRDGERAVGVVTGCLLLVRRGLWDDLGGLDPRFFMYGEDVDLSLRATSAGYRPRITSEATITHVVGASSSVRSSKVVMVLTGKATLVRKHWTGWRQRFGLAMLQSGVGLRALIATVVAAITGGRSGADQPWPDVWRARRQWVPGYATLVGEPPADGSTLR